MSMEYHPTIESRSYPIGPPSTVADDSHERLEAITKLLSNPVVSPQDPRAQVKFSEAAQSWFDSLETKSTRVRYLKPRTVKSYRFELEALTRFFGEMRLCDITNQDIEKYQSVRSEGLRPFKHPRHPAHLNEELRKLQKILTDADLWYRLAKQYQDLEEPFQEPRRVMTKQEEAHLFEVAASREEFAFVYAYSLLSVSTSASGAELRGLRLMDIDLIGRTLQINAQAAKNPYRVRSIPMVDDAVWAANSLLSRARSLGSTEPSHFLFPYKHGNRPHDPTRHMSDNGLQKQWHALRKAAGLPWITPHVLRYQCITKMAEAGIDRVTAKRVAGHVTDQMWDKYSRVRFDSIREKMAEAFNETSIQAHVKDAQAARRHSRKLDIQPLPEMAPVAPADIMHPAIQAEIARQVALALQQRRAAIRSSSPTEKGPSRLIAFPGKGGANVG